MLLSTPADQVTLGSLTADSWFMCRLCDHPDLNPDLKGRYCSVLTVPSVHMAPSVLSLYSLSFPIPKKDSEVSMKIDLAPTSTPSLQTSSQSVLVVECEHATELSVSLIHSGSRGCFTPHYQVSLYSHHRPLFFVGS